MIRNLTAIERFLLILYSLAGVSLLLYSFTQIDLGLVISRYPALYAIERNFQYIGYFNRPLSIVLFSLIIVSFFALYFWTLFFIAQKLFGKKTIWVIVLMLTVILFLSYNAFSYDLFNYIFDAKILTFYRENPYLHKALDYPLDPMLAFMHWTHRVYPYGPVWLGLTAPLSFIGNNIFLLTFYLFKLLIAASYVGTVYYIGRILEKISPDIKIFGMASFALNPLVLIESLVSAHNDIVMLFFMVFSLYLLLQEKYLGSIILYIVSIAIKFATAFILPVYFYLFYQRKKMTKTVWDGGMLAAIGLMLLAVFIVSLRSNYQPWYLLYCLPFISLLSKKSFITISSSIFSLVSLMNYLPFLYTGTWTSETMRTLMWINLAGFGIAGLLGFFFRRRFR